MWTLRTWTLKLAVAVLPLGVALAAHGSAVSNIVVAKVEGAIGPVSARFMVDAIERAERTASPCVVFELDTPGGLDESMRMIIKRIMASKVPVAVYVSPSGGRAASAGTFIVMCAHVAAMAPGTTIGAAHPVSIGGMGQSDTNMSLKVENDSAAYIRAVATTRGRNAEWAEKAVRGSVAITEAEALKEHVIDLVEPSLTSLLAALDGREVTVGTEKVKLRTREPAITRIEMNWRDRLLGTIANPNIAYILFMIGLLGLYFEFSSPGLGVPGVVGAISLILAFFAFQTLTVNYAGVLLIILSVILFIVDVKAATHGVLTIGGLVAMFIGSVMLFKTPNATLQVSMELIVSVVLVMGSFFTLGAWLSIRALKRRPTTGDAALLGEVGEARTAIAMEGGQVFVSGTHWNATSRTDIAAGVKVKVVGVKGMTLEVEEVQQQK